MDLTATTYASGTAERKILDEYRAAVNRALRAAHCVLYVDGLSVSTIRAIARDRGFEHLIADADAEYLRAVCDLTATKHSAPNARPVHT